MSLYGCSLILHAVLWKGPFASLVSLVLSRKHAFLRISSKRHCFSCASLNTADKRGYQSYEKFNPELRRSFLDLVDWVSIRKGIFCDLIHEASIALWRWSLSGSGRELLEWRDILKGFTSSKHSSWEIQIFSRRLECSLNLNRGSWERWVKRKEYGCSISRPFNGKQISQSSFQSFLKTQRI